MVNLLIKNLTFDKCGNILKLFTSENGITQNDYLASLIFHSCIHLQVMDVVIFNPSGYGMVGYNVIGNSLLLKESALK